MWLVVSILSVVIFYESLYNSIHITTWGIYYFLIGLFILVVNILQHFHYFKACFSYYITKVNPKVMLSLNMGAILELMNTGRQVQFLPSSKEKAHELVQHLWNVHKAFLNGGKIYCPSRKGSTHDGCYVDLHSGEITSVIQLKMKNLGLKFGPKYIDFCMKIIK